MGIKANHKRSKELQGQLKRAEAKLRQAHFEEGRLKGSAAQAKEKLLKAMVTQYHQKQALKSESQKVLDELKDEKSTRYKANKATQEAVKLAKTIPDQQQVDAKASQAKSL